MNSYFCQFFIRYELTCAARGECGQSIMTNLKFLVLPGNVIWLWINYPPRNNLNSNVGHRKIHHCSSVGANYWIWVIRSFTVSSGISFTLHCHVYKHPNAKTKSCFEEITFHELCVINFLLLTNDLEQFLGAIVKHGKPRNLGTCGDQWSNSVQVSRYFMTWDESIKSPPCVANQALITWYLTV